MVFKSWLIQTYFNFGTQGTLFAIKNALTHFPIVTLDVFRAELACRTSVVFLRFSGVRW